MTIKDRIQQIAAMACPTYTFAFDAKTMFNVDADDRRFPCIFLEEYGSGRQQRKYGWRKTVTAELHFMTLAPMEGDASEREDIREEMEAAAVIPFMDALNASGAFAEVNDFRIEPEPPLFDANAVSLLVTVELTINRCELLNPHPQPNNNNAQ